MGGMDGALFRSRLGQIDWSSNSSANIAKHYSNWAEGKVSYVKESLFYHRSSWKNGDVKRLANRNKTSPFFHLSNLSSFAQPPIDIDLSRGKAETRTSLFPNPKREDRSYSPESPRAQRIASLTELNTERIGKAWESKEARRCWGNKYRYLPIQSRELKLIGLWQNTTLEPVKEWN